MTLEQVKKYRNQTNKEHEEGLSKAPFYGMIGGLSMSSNASHPLHSMAKSMWDMMFPKEEGRYYETSWWVQTEFPIHVGGIVAVYAQSKEEAMIKMKEKIADRYKDLMSVDEIKLSANDWYEKDEA